MNTKNKNADPVEVEDVTAVAETENGKEDAGAILIEFDDDDPREIWIPKSEIFDDSDVRKMGDSGTLIIPQWLAEDRELV